MLKIRPSPFLDCLYKLADDMFRDVTLRPIASSRCLPLLREQRTTVANVSLKMGVR